MRESAVNSLENVGTNFEGNVMETFLALKHDVMNAMTAQSPVTRKIAVESIKQKYDGRLMCAFVVDDQVYISYSVDGRERALPIFNLPPYFCARRREVFPFDLEDLN